MPLTHLGCPSCGGTLSLAEGQRIVPCRYCGVESLVLIPRAVPRYVVRREVARQAAWDLAREFLRRPALPRAVRERGRLQELCLFYVPFYESTGTRLGTFLLRETVKPPAPVVEAGEDGREFQRWLLQPPVSKEDTRVIQQEFLRIRPACHLPELGVGHIRLEEMRRGPSTVLLEPYDPVKLQSQAVVFAPTKSPGRFSEDMQRRVKVSGDRTGVVEQRLKLLYYPVWQARYRHAGRGYEVALDGVTGSVLAWRAPAEVRRAAAVAVAALAIAALWIGRPVRQFLRQGLWAHAGPGFVIGAAGTILALTLGALAALFVAWVGWTTFRRGAEMTLDGMRLEPRPGAAAVGERIEGIRARLAGWLLPRGPGIPGQG